MHQCSSWFEVLAVNDIVGRMLFPCVRARFQRPNCVVGKILFEKFG